MADTSVPRAQMGAATLNRKWYLDVDTSAEPHTVPVWIGVFGVTEFKNTMDPTSQDTSDFSSGYKSDTITALGWGAELKLSRKVTAASAAAYDPGQEFLRLAAQGMGLANRVHVRIYEMNGATGPKIESYDGYVSVTWEPEGGDFAAVDSVTCKLSGQGIRNTIAHPAV